MGLRRFLSGRRSKDSDDEGRPPKPEPDELEKEQKVSRYEATVEYQNGETETFECYGADRGDHTVTFKLDLKPNTSLLFDEPTLRHETRSVNYETLAREPVLERAGTDLVTFTYTLEWEWGYAGYPTIGLNKTWAPSPTDLSVTVEPVEG